MKLPNVMKCTRITEREYRANLDGMNIFFGAVLGIVLGGTETMAPLKFAGLLAMSAGAVISVLYISSSRNRLAYAAVTALIVAMLPRMLESVIGPGLVPDHLQPTLAVWATMVVGVEFLPREAEPQESASSPAQ